MRLITIDKLRLTAGLRPNPALLRFALSKRVLAIVPFVLKEELVGTGRNYFSREGVTEAFLFGNCEVVLRAPVIVSMPLLIVHFAIVVSLIINE